MKLDNLNCRGPQKSLSYKLCSPFALATSFRSSLFHFLAKFSKIVRFSSHVKRNKMKLSLLYKNVNTSSHRKSNAMALTAVYQFELRLKVRDMPSKLSLPRHYL